MKILVSAVLGVLLGFLASKMLFLQWLTLIPWGIAAILVGYWSDTNKSSFLYGALYGFFLGFVFMVGQYNGSDPLITKIPAFVALGGVSAVCGLILSFAGRFLRVKVR